MSEHTTRHVYFIGHTQEYREQQIKIGCTKNIELRIRTLQTGTPRKLHLLGVIPFGDTLVESQLHKRFIDQHVRGEWFEANWKLLSFIRHWANPRIMYCQECRTTFEEWYGLYYTYRRANNKGIILPPNTLTYVKQKSAWMQPHQIGCKFGPNYTPIQHSEGVKYLARGWMK